MTRRGPFGRHGWWASTLFSLLAAGCSFEADVSVDDMGRTTVRCDGPESCPPGLRCGAGLCIDPARVRPVVIEEPVTRRPDGTPASRFSRQPGFEVAHIDTRIDGAPSAVELSAGPRLTPCVELEPARFRCELRVDAEVNESLVVQLVVRDVRGDEQRRAVPLTVDLTAPALVAGGSSAFVTPPPGSPLRPPLTPTAVAPGSTVQLRFSLSEAVATAPRVSLGGTSTSELAMVDANGVYGVQLVVPSSLQAEAVFEVEASDLVGNQAQARFPVTFPLAQPPGPLSETGPTLERVPFGRIDGGAPELRLTTPSPDGVGWLAVWDSRDAGFPIAVTALTPDAGRLSVPLAARDLSRVWTSRIDAAGLESARALVRAVTLTVRPTSGFGNPSLLEARPAFIAPLLLEQPVSLDLPSLSTIDADEAVVDSQYLWRPEGTGVSACNDDVMTVDRPVAQGLRFSGFSVGTCDGRSLVIQTGRALERGLGGLPFEVQAPFASFDLRRRRALSVSTLVTQPQPPRLVAISRTGVQTLALTLDAGLVAGAYDLQRDVHVLVTSASEVLALPADLRGPMTSLGQLPRLGRGSALRVPAPNGVLVSQAPNDGGGVATWMVDAQGLHPTGTLPPRSTPTWIPTVGLFAFGPNGAFVFTDGGFERLDGGPGAVLPEVGWEERRGPVVSSSNGNWLVSERGVEQTDGGVFDAPFPKTTPPPPLTRGLAMTGGDGGVFATSDEGQRWFGWTPSGWEPIANHGRFSGLSLAAAATSTDGYLVVADAGLFRRPLVPGGDLTLVRAFTGPMAPLQAVSTGDAIVVVSSSPSVSVRFPIDGGVPTSTSVVPVEASSYGFIAGTCLVHTPIGPVLGFANTAGNFLPFPQRFAGSSWSRLPASWSDVSDPSCSFDPVRQRVLSFGGLSRRIAGAVADDAVLSEHALDGGSTIPAVWAPWGAPAGRTFGLFAHEAATGRHLLWGGRTQMASRSDGWSLETSTVLAGLVWRLPLEPLDVPLTARLRRLEVRVVGRGTSPQGDGVELLGWTAGAWRRPLTPNPAATSLSPAQPLEASFVASELMDLDLHSLGVGVRSLGSAGPGVSRVAVDAVELTLRYELPPE